MKTQPGRTTTTRSASSTTTRQRWAGASTASRCSERVRTCRGSSSATKPDEVLLAHPGRGAGGGPRRSSASLEPFKIPIKTLPNLRDILDGQVRISQIRGLAVEDLLARAPVGLDRGCR